METRTKIIIAVVALLGAFGAGWYLTPTKVVTKTEIKTVEKVVEKVIEKDKSTTQNDKVTIVTETTYPDGRKVKETKIVDKSVLTSITSKKDDTTTDKSSDTITEKTVERAQASLSVSALGALKITSLTDSPAFGLAVSKRVLGPFTVGAFGLSNGVGGVSVGVLF